MAINPLQNAALEVKPVSLTGALPALTSLAELGRIQAQTALTGVQAARQNALFDAMSRGDTDTVARLDPKTAGEMIGLNRARSGYEAYNTYRANPNAPGAFDRLSAADAEYAHTVSQTKLAVAQQYNTMAEGDRRTYDLKSRAAGDAGSMVAQAAALVDENGAPAQVSPMAEARMRASMKAAGAPPEMIDQTIGAVTSQDPSKRAEALRLGQTFMMLHDSVVAQAAPAVAGSTSWVGDEQKFASPLSQSLITGRVGAGGGAAPTGETPQPLPPSAGPIINPLSGPGSPQQSATDPFAAAGPARVGGPVVPEPTAAPAIRAPQQSPVPGQSRFENGRLILGGGPGTTEMAKAQAAELVGAASQETNTRNLTMQQSVNSMLTALDNPDVFTGAGGEALLNISKGVQTVKSLFGSKNPQLDGQITSLESFNKNALALASEYAQAGVGSRVTNFDLSTFINSNPGLGTSLDGNKRLLGVVAQMVDRERVLNTEAARAVGASGTPQQKWSAWREAGETYDKSHPIVDPQTGRVLTTAAGTVKDGDYVRVNNEAEATRVVTQYHLLPGAMVYYVPTGQTFPYNGPKPKGTQ